MIKLTLPTWINNNEIVRLKNALFSLWILVEEWVKWPLTQTNADDCIEEILNLMAWGRGIDRFDSEPLWLYRKRVKFARVNAQDAGSVVGFKRIFERLGIGEVEVIERDPFKDWDVITLRISDEQMASNYVLLQVIIAMYGRTCRRYVFSIVSPAPISITGVAISHNSMTLAASL